jgi:prepilin signal peptidase PulO-like enzyme (type II secretory pathway)
MAPSIIAALILGWLCGIAVNLLADYLPARRHHFLARTNPFVSPEVVPPQPNFLPRRPDGRVWPVFLWSGLIAQAAGVPVFGKQHRARRLLTEIGMALVFAAIALQFADNRNLVFLLFYAPCLALIVIIDVEHRWVFLETIFPPAIVALVEATFWTRVLQRDEIKGGVYGFAIMVALYVFGMLFAWIISKIGGRPVNRTVLGVGDVYIGTLAGLLVGWSSLGLALLIMVTAGAIAALLFIANKLIRTGRYRLYSAIPYGPYIVIGTATMLYVPQVMVLFAQTVLHWPL